MIQCDLFGFTGFYFRNRRNKIPPKHAITFLIILATNYFVYIIVLTNFVAVTRHSQCSYCKRPYHRCLKGREYTSADAVQY